MGRILVFNAGFKGLAFAKDLINSGHEVFLYDYRDGAFGQGIKGLASTWEFRRKNPWWDDIYPHPVRKSGAFRTFVLDHIKKLRPDIIFPVNSEEIEELYLIKRQIEELTKWATGPNYLYSRLNDKVLFWIYHGVDLEDIYIPRTIIVDDCNYYNKPAKGHSGKGVKKITLTNGVLQEEVKGEGVGFEALVDNGEVIAHFSHMRIRELPIKGGSSTARKFWYDTALERLGREIIGKTGWTGFIMLEFKRVSRGCYKLIELNPRPWGSIQLAIDADVRFPTIAYDYFVTGKKPAMYLGTLKRRNQPRKVETRNVPLDIIAGICHLFKGDWKQFWDSISLWKDFRWEAFNWKQPVVCLLYLYTMLKMLLIPAVNWLRR